MIKFSGGNGGSIEDAVIILGARHTLEGIQAEKRYISKALLRVQNIDWELKGQKLIITKRNSSILIFLTSLANIKLGDVLT